MKKESVKVRIKMLGNFGLYESGQVVDVTEDQAATLLSLGYAILADAPVAQAKE